MPSWGIHLMTANDIIKQIDVKNTNEFLIGNFLPDILNGYAIKNPSQVIPYNESHYFLPNEERFLNLPKIPNPDTFLEVYEDKLPEPIVLGSYIHLLTDVFWNTTVINKYLQMGIDYPSQKLKQLDFINFGNYLINRSPIIEPFYEETLVSKANLVMPLTDSDLKQTIDFINEDRSDRTKGLEDEYRLFPKPELLEIHNDCVKYIIKHLDELKVGGKL